MHIAYVCGDLGVPISGTKGASVHVRSLAQALSHDHLVSVIAANPGEGTVEGFRPKVHAAGYDRTLKRLKRRVAAETPGSTKSREVYALLLGNLAYRKLEELHRARPIDAIYERHSLWSWAGLAFARATGVPHVLELNAPLVEEQSTYRGLALADVARACERELVSGTDAVVVPSEALARHASRLGARAEGVYVMPNAIDPELFATPPAAPAARRSPFKGRFVVAFVGSLKPWHGIEPLIDAFHRLLRSTPDAHLLVVGDGPSRTAVEKAAAELGDGRVSAPGAVPHDEIPGWLAQADVGVAPYPEHSDFYFSPMKIVEYQAAGLAAVASDLGHIRSQIDHLETGVLVPAGDSRALADALSRLARQPTLARSLGKRARATVMREHTWGGIAERVVAILRKRCRSGLRLAASRGTP